MLLVALVGLAVAAGLVLAGFALGCVVTNANRDDDIWQAIEYERERHRER